MVYQQSNGRISLGAWLEGNKKNVIIFSYAYMITLLLSYRKYRKSKISMAASSRL